MLRSFCHWFPGEVCVLLVSRGSEGKIWISILGVMGDIP